jgi:uncharacterized protein YqeY
MNDVQELWSYQAQIKSSCERYLPSPLDDDDIDSLIQELIKANEEDI